MASIEESVSEISTVQDHVNTQQAGVLEVSGKLEEVSGKAAAAKQEIEGMAAEATGAATNLEEIISLTMAIGYGPNAQEVNAVKELVEEARNVLQAAGEQVAQLTTQIQAAKTELEQANAQLQKGHTTLDEAKTRLQSLALVTRSGGAGAAGSSASGAISGQSSISSPVLKPGTGTYRATVGFSSSTNYKKTFFQANPDQEGKVVVHHAVEQQIRKRYEGLFKEGEIHSIENLRGIPKGQVNNKVHLSAIRKAWNRFYRDNPKPTREQVLDFATEVDLKYGDQFDPPLEL